MRVLLGDAQPSDSHHRQGPDAALETRQHPDLLLFVNWDHDGPCFVTAFDKRTGQQRWKVDRDEETSWSSPILVENDGKPLLIVAGTNRVRAYEPATGKVIWECGGLSSNIVATPVAADGMLYAGSSYEKKAFLAIRLDRAKGDITGTDRIAWTRSNQRMRFSPIY